MGFSLEFFMTNGDVVAADSMPAPRDATVPASAMSVTTLKCEDMDTLGIRAETYAIAGDGEVAAVSDVVLLLDADAVRKVYKVVNNNRDFMLRGEGGRLLNPTETQEMLDAIAADVGAALDDETYSAALAAGEALGAGAVDLETGELDPDAF